MIGNVAENKGVLPKGAERLFEIRDFKTVYKNQRRRT